MKKRAYIYPANDTNDEFITSIRMALQSNNVIVTDSLKDFLRTRIFILNWYENIYNQQHIFIKRYIFLILLWICKKKIVVFLHNIRPHSKYHTTVYYHLSEKLLRLLIKHSSALVCLSETSISYFPLSTQELLQQFSTKIYYIPHPNFTQYFYSPKNIPTQKLRLLCFGGIETYKGVEIAVNAMNNIHNQDIELWIIGTSSDKARQTRLKEMSTNPNTHFLFQYIPNEELGILFSYFDLCIYPLDTYSCLNSSSILLSFSQRTSVICPHIATLDEYPCDHYITYQYNSISEHISTLTTLIEQSKKDKETNPNIFLSMGIECYEDILRNNSQETINAKWGELLSEL